MNDERIAVYSDYVCPFCYLGRRSLESYLEGRESDLAVEWRPFDLRGRQRGPDGELDRSVDDGKDDAYFRQVQENVERLRDRYDAGEMLDLSELPDEVDSFDAQLAALYVRDERPDRWSAFDAAVFEALWVDGRDVGDVEVLADLADGVGVDAAEVRRAIGDDRLRTRLREAFEEARRLGITGVPTFVYDGHAARGAVPPEQIRRLVEGF